ncbi:hypothetical protein [Mesorhizobium sp. M2A.F.Ca.ET.067.02.1.1]|uniref:hypothetical protein n=1 Tax=Mesorhizobium sp. M2A.F.Ca.ET.067.02.1.1 TaxID=2496749 RepID=UPI000FD38506|nr:hypothetical protein [Mesorhizobium sp. M2A.F.Ca.ET.067.02.1.1]RUW81497.1 hypothetical protein EOA28_00790 [Mesorhizobium sp. M2A.F.Ca.ET.067.02.1.1]TIU58001.1 MAG: hypothetical protein E5W35_06495 [Mesorhizobium sp.]
MAERGVEDIIIEMEPSLSEAAILARAVFMISESRILPIDRELANVICSLAQRCVNQIEDAEMRRTEAWAAIADTRETAAVTG